jgi:hypothetical protein
VVDVDSEFWHESLVDPHSGGGVNVKGAHTKARRHKECS